jgi:hypothetical protein
MKGKEKKAKVGKQLLHDVFAFVAIAVSTRNL